MSEERKAGNAPRHCAIKPIVSAVAEKEAGISDGTGTVVTTETKPLVATFGEGGTDEPRVRAILELVRQRVGLDVQTSRVHGTYVQVESVDAAGSWVERMITSHTDGGVMIGSDSDSLVRRMPEFRLNEQLWNLLSYIISGRVTVAADGGRETWSIAVSDSKAPEKLQAWFRDVTVAYKLVPSQPSA